MTNTNIAPYGSWKSPIISDQIASQTVGLDQIQVDGKNIYWLEARPTENGRNVIVKYNPAGNEDQTPPDLNVRNRVHEYGGGDYLVVDGTIYFTNFTDQQIYRQKIGGAPECITSESNSRYASFILDKYRNRLICIREEFRPEAKHPQNTIVSVDLKSGANQTLVSGNDFYSSIKLNPDGSRLCYLTWNHPNMPWDGTELRILGLQSNGTPDYVEKVAGGLNESVFQPEFSANGTLYFVSDRSGWWNIYRRGEHSSKAVYPMEAEFGRPQWRLGAGTYTFLSPDEMVVSYNVKDRWHLACLNLKTQKLNKLNLPFTAFASLAIHDDQVLFVGGLSNMAGGVVCLDLKTEKYDFLQKSTDMQFDPGYISEPELVQYPSEGRTAFGLYYAPCNKDFTAPANEKPPLLVLVHGGPTSSAGSSLSLLIQYYTGRGFAVLNVNYGGSVGFGRAYRSLLNGNWGIVDTQDCLNGARYLAGKGLADEKRMAISGGSSGGYTAICALTFHDTFQAGASHFGICDLEAILQDTHKFESRYPDNLVGRYPEKKDVYRERSPIHFTERLSAPMIFLQGLEDRVVPPNQTEKMVEALRTKGLPVAYLSFEGEQHGFRKTENIKLSLDSEFYFYSRIFGFEPAEQLEPVKIENF